MYSKDFLALEVGEYKISDGIYTNTLYVTKRKGCKHKKDYMVKVPFTYEMIHIYPKDGDVEAYLNFGGVFFHIGVEKFGRFNVIEKVK